jgi:hypothetical protein
VWWGKEFLADVLQCQPNLYFVFGFYAIVFGDLDVGLELAFRKKWRRTFVYSLIYPHMYILSKSMTLFQCKFVIILRND